MISLLRRQTIQQTAVCVLVTMDKDEFCQNPFYCNRDFTGGLFVSSPAPVSSCIPIKKNCINATSGETHTCERSCLSSHANGASGIFMYSVIEGSPRNHTIKTAAAPVRAVGKFREEIRCGQWLCVQLWHHSKT